MYSDPFLACGILMGLGALGIMVLMIVYGLLKAGLGK